MLKKSLRKRREPLSLGGLLRLMAVGLSVLAGACMIGPDYKPPPAPVAKVWTEGGTASVDTARQEYRDWWSVFNDPVLSRLIDVAYHQNLTLMTAGVRVLEARAELGVAIGEFFPQQQLVSASVSYNRLPISVPYHLLSNTYWSDSFGAQAGWELDVWGKLRRGIETADDAFLASVADYDDVLVTLTGDVASDYVQIRTIEKQIMIARDNVVRQRDAYKIALAKYRGGSVRRPVRSDDKLKPVPRVVQQTKIFDLRRKVCLFIAHSDDDGDIRTQLLL